MFTIIGILSLLAGVYVFFQTGIIHLGANVLGSVSPVAGAVANAFSWPYLILSLALLTAGALSLASRNGENHGLIRTAAIAYAVGFVASLFKFGIGSTLIWCIACAALAVLYFIKSGDRDWNRDNGNRHRDGYHAE